MKLNLKILSTVLLLSTSLVFMSCGKEEKKKGGGKAKKESAENVESEEKKTDGANGENATAGVPESLDESSLKVRNFNQFYNTYAALLDLDVQNTEYRDYFDDVSLSLPTESNPKGFLGAHQLAAVKLSSKACDLFYLNSSDQKKQEYLGISFQGGEPSVVFSNDNLDTMSKNMMERMWGDGKSNAEDIATINTMVKDALRQFEKSNPTVTPAQLLRAGAVSACTAIMGSAAVSFY